MNVLTNFGLGIVLTWEWTMVWVGLQRLNDCSHQLWIWHCVELRTHGDLSLTPASKWIWFASFDWSWYLRDGNLPGSGMSHATTASPKPSFGAPWRAGDAVVVRGNAGWTTSRNGLPCPCQKCSHKDQCWIVPHVPPDELNWLLNYLFWKPFFLSQSIFRSV